MQYVQNIIIVEEENEPVQIKQVLNQVSVLSRSTQTLNTHFVAPFDYKKWLSTATF